MTGAPQIYDRLGKRDEWTAFFEPLVAKHKRKRNLMSALKKRKLFQ